MVAKLIVVTLVWFGAFGAILFVSAGTLSWPGAWAFLAEMVGPGLAIGLWLGRHDPALLQERLRPLVQRDQAPADKALMSLFLVLMVSWLVLMGLNMRFQWSLAPPWAQVLGAVGIAVSIYSGYLTMRENSFAAPVVKVQKDRGQTVVTTPGLTAMSVIRCTRVPSSISSARRSSLAHGGDWHSRLFLRSCLPCVSSSRRRPSGPNSKALKRTPRASDIG